MDDQNITGHKKDGRNMWMIGDISVVKAPDGKVPRCPYCKNHLETIWEKVSGLGIMGRKEILMCPHCESFLGYSSWKRN
jgi:hypothetical protein